MKVNILYTVPTLDPRYGGPTTCSYHLLRGLNKLVKVDLLTPTNHDGSPFEWQDSFIKSVPFDAKTPLYYSHNFVHYIKEQVQKYDLVHVNTIWTLYSSSAARIARHHGLPVMLSPHGMLYPQALNKKSWKKKLALFLFQSRDLHAADCLHATCMQELEHIRNFGLKNPVCVVPNCLPQSIETLVPRVHENEIRKIGFVGRIDRIKRIDLLIKAWIKLGCKTAGSELHIIGSGDAKYAFELQQLAAMSNNVCFKGFITGDDLQKEIHMLDYLVLPSESENFGMVVPEALAHGVPVIASSGTPWNELNEHQCGWWINCTEDSLSDILEFALTLTEVKRTDMGVRGRELVLHKYTENAVAQNMLECYQYLLGRGDKPNFYYE